MSWLDDLRAKGLLDDKEYISAVAGVQGITLSLTKGKENLTKDHLAGIKSILDVDVKQVAALQKQLAAELKLEEKKALQAQIKELNDEIKGLKQQYGDLLFGVEPDNGVEYFAYDPKNDSQNIKGVLKLMESNPNASFEQLVDAVADWAHIPKSEATALVNKAGAKGR